MLDCPHIGTPEILVELHNVWPINVVFFQRVHGPQVPRKLLNRSQFVECTYHPDNLSRGIAKIRHIIVLACIV